MRMMSKISRWTGLTFLAIVISLAAGDRAQAAFSNAVAGYTQGSVNGGPTQSLGFDFKVNQGLTINELGAYEASSTSITQGQTVYLYDVSKSTLIASTTLTGGFTLGNFNYASITPVALTTGDTYSLFSVFTASSTQYGMASSLTFSPDLTIVPIGGANTGYTQGSAAVPPSSPFGNILAVDLQYSPTSVPEPTSLSMLALGSFSLGGLLIRRARKSKSC